MAGKDLYHGDGNASVKAMLSEMKPKDRTGSNTYGYGKKGPKLPTTKKREEGWSK
jgi:hypothetical protein